MRPGKDVEPPVVGIDSVTRIVDPAARDVPALKDLPDDLEVPTIFLAELHVQSAVRPLWHPTFRVEVPSHVVDSLTGSNQWRGVVVNGEE